MIKKIDNEIDGGAAEITIGEKTVTLLNEKSLTILVNKINEIIERLENIP